MTNEAAKRVKLTESELRDGLRVSKVTLWTYRKRGMPVLAQGRRGVENEYDAGAVITWLRAHPADGSARTFALLERAALLASRLGLDSAAVVPAAQFRSEIISAPEEAVRALAGSAFGIALANSLIVSCGLFAY